jgi:hypothetical protein
VPYDVQLRGCARRSTGGCHVAAARSLSRMFASLAVVASAVVPVVAGTGGPASAVVNPATVTRGTFGYGDVQLLPPSGTTAPADCVSPSTTPGGTEANVNAGAEYDCATEDATSYESCTTSTFTGGSSTSCEAHVQAVAPAGWRFDHWSGDCSGTASACTVPTSQKDCDNSAKPPCTTTTYDVSTIAHFVDTRAPTTSFSQAPANNTVVYSDAQSQSFGFSTDEDGEGPSFACGLDSPTIFGCFSGYTWSSIADGVHDFCVVATDASGLQGSTACRHWEQETNPTASISNYPPMTTTSPTATFAYTSNKAHHPADGSTLSYQCKLDSDALAACPFSGKTYSGLANGTHMFSVTAAFTAALGGGAHTALASYSWTQDDPDLRGRR